MYLWGFCYRAWLASSGPSNILALEEVPVGCMGPRRAWICSLVQCTDGVSAQVGELKSTPEVPIAFCPILAPCDQLPHSPPFHSHKCHLPTGPPSWGQGCTAPSLYTRYHSEGLVPLPVPFSCNYVEQTRAADGKGAAISLTFRDWSCWEEMGRPMGGGF